MEKRPFKKILNLHETITHKRLKDVCKEYESQIFSKVRIADILPIENSGISDRAYHYALSGHFDFVVSDKDANPLFAVEFDGPYHDNNDDQIKRDKIKNGLVEKFEFPMLRIRSTHLQKKYDGWDLLSWFVDVWFMQEEADRMQRDGELPYDFDFDPTMILSSPDKERRFPYWLGLDAQLAIQSLYENRKIKDMTPSMSIAYDGEKVCRGMAYIRLDDETCVYVTTGMRRQSFTVGLYDAIRGVLNNDIYMEIKAALSDPSHPRQTYAVMDAIAKKFTDRYPGGSHSGYSGDWFDRSTVK